MKSNIQSVFIQATAFIRKLLIPLGVLLSFSLFTGCSSSEDEVVVVEPESGVSVASETALASIESLGIRNLSSHPEAKVYASGQPTQKELVALSDAGVKHVISLRKEGEIDWDEKAYVESLGMVYHSIPIDVASGVTFKNASVLRNLLSSVEDETTVLHCGSSDRVGALIALDAYESNGGDLERAIETGKNWGLATLESLVREQVQ